MFVNFLSSGTIFGLPMAQGWLFLDYRWPKTLCGVVKYSFWITDGPKPCVRFVKCSFWITNGLKSCVRFVKCCFWITNGPKSCVRFVNCSFWITNGPKPCVGFVKYSFWIMDGPNLLHIPNKTAIGHIPNWTLNKRIVHNLVQNLSATILQE